MVNWIICTHGRGFLYVNGEPEKIYTSFNKNSIGEIKEETDTHYHVWLIGTNNEWLIPKEETTKVDVTKTGDKFDYKICNVCHCWKPVDHFQKNQNNLHGAVRRPSCRKCRTDIDKRAPKTKQAKEMEKLKPKTGQAFVCPICRKRSIVGVTAKIVADHDHHTGNIRGWLCDSCNTGLGRFKNGENYLMNAYNYIVERDTLK